MEPGKHSITAESMASRRAFHYLLDRPLVLDDPLSIRLLDREAQERIALHASQPRPPGHGPFRALAAARSRFCEDALAAAVQERDVRQLVILGAGFDTFAYRNPLAATIKVFEVDYPSSQILKRQRLREANIPEPPSLTFVPLDLQQRSLLEALVAGGARTNEPTFFSALGLVNYLSPETLRQLFAMVATAFPLGSEMAFDYAVPPRLMPEDYRQTYLQWRERVAQAGERILSDVVPSELRQTLMRAGFRDVEQLDTAAINGRYFFARRDGLRAGPSWGLVRAAV